MAEVAGLALSVVGVVGVIGAFKDAIDLFAMITAPRQFSRDYEVVTTKLDIEKMMLLQWADRVRLLHGDYDKRLTDDDIAMGIRRTLHCIRMLMADAQQLNKRYSVAQIPSHETTELPAPISSARMARFVTEFRERMLWEDATHPKATAYSLCEFPSHKSTSTSTTVGGTRVERFIAEFLDRQNMEAPKHKSKSVSTKFRWAIRDKDKFERLMAEIAYFTAKLNQLVPPNYPHYIQDVSAGLTGGFDEYSRDLPSLTDLRRVETILGAPLEAYGDFTRRTKYDLGRRVGTTLGVPIGEYSTFSRRAYYPMGRRKDIYSDKVLDTIWSRLFDDRRDGVKEAHYKTLDWVLRTPDTDAIWDDMSQWILSGSGIYWICGKAGSGKSTLMKNLLFHPTLPALLSRWSRGDPCVAGSFFFLNLGHPLQRSQEGLARAVIYQILSSSPELIPKMLPRMWKNAQILKDNEDLRLPTTSEIAHAIKVFAADCDAQKKFCFFIDGIDELEGDYLEGISFIQQLTANGHAKAVVSSRPIPDCMLAFKQCPQLKLEQLNREDISNYVNDKISRNSYMLKLLRQSPKQAAEIVQDLVDKSSGVFLWVVLACRSLINGFADCDRLPELRRRVEELPPELHELFDLMMSKIKTRHKEEGAKLLRMFLRAQAR
ncbi:prion-inhibition and propagation-domain-containing protein [Diaporthe sp. PMI_573]|nr:prion-inhibition and propagation-domain-containing protein [Diaporthaceae sp. PMI_573]